MRTYLFLSVTLLTLVSPCPAAETTKCEPPNFVVVFFDDLGYADLGCFGSKSIRTPNIDRLAAEGTKFTSFYAQPICGPSRTALMTGCYPLRVAEADNLKRQHPAVHAEEITLAEVLATKGYRSGCFGKWDMAEHSQRDFKPRLMPNQQGFKYFFGTPSSNDRSVDLYRNDKLLERNADMAMLTQRYTDEAISFIDRNQDRPFFVYLPHTMPHVRLAASKDFAGKSKRGLYGDVVEEIDHNVGRIVDKLKQLKLAEKTYVVVTSDNGPWLSKSRNFRDGIAPVDHGGSAGPLRSGKVSTWEGGIRVPTVVWAPNRVPAGKSCDAITATIDLLPTFAELAGAEVPDDRTIDGRSIAPLFAGKFEEADAERVFYGYFGTELQTVRQGPWKLHLVASPGSGPWNQRNRHIGPADDRTHTEYLLYNLDDDLGESKNVAKDNEAIVEQLLQLAEQARAEIGDFNRIGSGARFYDEGPRRPDVKKPGKE